MKILVTGAEGSLASAFIPALIEKGHEVSVSDMSDTHSNAVGIANPNKHESCYMVNLEHVIPADVTYKIRRREIDCIIHCAEDTIPSLDSRIIYTNIYYLAEVLKACAETGIRCIVPTWKELNYAVYPDILWKSSIRYKKNLVKFYNIGNAVINLINIPRIILSGMHPDIYGNIICRFYDIIYNLRKFIINNNEFGLNEYTRIDSVIDSILHNISMKIRCDYVVDGYYVEDQDLLSYLLYISSYTQFIDIYSGNNDPITIRRPKNEPSDKLVCNELKEIISTQFS